MRQAGLLLRSNFFFQNLLSYPNALLARKPPQFVPHSLASAFDLTFRLVPHPFQFTLSRGLNSFPLRFEFGGVTLFYFRNLFMKRGKPGLDSGKFRKRLISFLFGLFQFSLYRFTSRAQSISKRSTKYVKANKNKEQQIDKLPQLQTRIIPPGRAPIHGF